MRRIRLCNLNNPELLQSLIRLILTEPEQQNRVSSKSMPSLKNREYSLKSNSAF